MQIQESFLKNVPRDMANDDWLIISFLALALIYLGIRIIYNKFWRRYRLALLYNQESQKLIQEKNVLLMQAAISMNVTAMFSLGMFAFIFSIKFGLFQALPNNFYGWMLSTIAVIIIFGGKHLINQFMGHLGDSQIATNQINHHWLINIKNFGFFMLPITAAAAYINSPLDGIVLFLGLATLVFMLILNYIKGFAILFQYRVSVFYGILYLCTLEILPVLIVWKLISL